MSSDESPAQAAHSGNRKPQSTIYDVARATGVSPSTVSRALNKPGRINAKTEKRIRDAAAELNYRLNPMARALPTGRTGTLGLILSDITNPVYFSLVRGAEQVTSSLGYTLVLAESQESPELELETAQRLLVSVDGLVLVASRLPDDAIIELADQKPLVMVNRRVDGVDAVIPNVAPGIREALDHLKALGHNSLAYLSGPAASWMSRLRWDTLLEQAVDRGMSIVEIGPGAPTLDGGRDALRRVRAAGVSAVVAYNDLMAIGLLLSAKESGLVVPDDLSIVGFDDIFGSDFTSPPLTTIRTPLGAVGDEAMRGLIASLDSADHSAPFELQTELVMRGSTSAR